MNYLGKHLNTYFLSDLETILSGLQAAEDRRNEASTHEKFTTDRTIGNKKIPKMEFPPPNPEFLKLKSAIEAEIESRKNA